MGDRAGCRDEQRVTRVRINAPFWMGVCEITNEQYACFDPTHDSHVESKNAYQFGTHGFPVNGPKQPVVRVSWQRARAFCRWLAERTGLPRIGDVGYATPGSFGTWGAEHDIAVITYELPRASTEELVRRHVPVLRAVLAGEAPTR